MEMETENKGILLLKFISEILAKVVQELSTFIRLLRRYYLLLVLSYFSGGIPLRISRMGTPGRL